MPTALNNEGVARGVIGPALRRFGLKSFLGRIAATILTVAALAGAACKKQSSQVAAESAGEQPGQRAEAQVLPSAEPKDVVTAESVGEQPGQLAEARPLPSANEEDKVVAATIGEKPAQPAQAQPSPAAKRKGLKKPREGYAVWYDVPDNSLAKRRAGKGELTAAHNRLPMGSVVRVTHLANQRSVIVRITDRGITGRASIDLCKEAAEELGMIREGQARVRMEVLPDDMGIDAGPDDTGTAAHP